MKRPSIDEPNEHEDSGPLFARARTHDPDTSKAAAASLSADALSRLHEIVLTHLERAGEAGMTTREISAATEIDRDSLSPRMPKLVELGRVYDSGERRAQPGKSRTCIVWKLKAGD